MEEKFVEMPWLLMAQTVSRSDRMIGIDGELSAALCSGLMIDQAEKSILEGQISNSMDEIRAIEKAGSSLQQDEDGSNYYRIDPNVAGTSQVIKKLKESARQILDSERGHYIATMLGEQAFFQVEHRVIEIAAVNSSGVYQLVTTRVGADGDKQRAPRIMDRLGLISLESRWGHIVDIEQWKAYVAEHPPASLPRLDTPMESLPGIYTPQSRKPKTGSLLLDGISEDGSFWD